jgi:hypothetical protein
MLLEGLGQLKNPVTSESKTRDLPACSIVPQPTTLPRAPVRVLNPVQNMFDYAEFRLLFFSLAFFLPCI